MNLSQWLRWLLSAFRRTPRPGTPAGIWQFRQGIIGRSDLLAVLQSGDQAAVQMFCQMLQLDRRPEQSAESPDIHRTGTQTTRRRPSQPAVSTGYPQRAQPLPLWRCAEQVSPRQQATQTEYPPWQGWSATPTNAADLLLPLEPWSELEPRVRGMLDQLLSSAIDVERLVSQVARLESISRIPRRLKRAWGRSLFVVREDSTRLAPLHNDQQLVIQRLRRLLPPGALRHVRGVTPDVLWYDVEEHPDLSEQDAVFHQPDDAATLLVLSDLGVFDDTGKASAAWLLWARRMVSAGHRPLVLLPCAEDRLSPALRDLFTVRTWQSPRVLVRDATQRTERLEQLAVAAAPAIRLEPGLLRELRQVGLGCADGSLELDYWNSSWLRAQHPFAGTPDRQIACESLLPLFEQWPNAQRRQVLHSMRQWRRTRQECPEIWFEELLSLSASSRQLAEPQDVAEALSLHADYRQHVNSDTEHGRNVCGWLRSAIRRYPRQARDDQQVGPLLQPLVDAVLNSIGKPGITGVSQEQRCCVIQPMGQRLQVQVLSQAPGALAVPPRMAELKTARDAAQLQADLERATALGGELRLAGDFGRLRLEQFERPRWATAVGYDRYGVWADLSVGVDAAGRERSQRLRWIPCGEFWMGSPADEPGRDEDELLHQVRITRGYWFFDSACPQWLWESVMGGNPSRFRDADRPVEQVSWDNCQEFLLRLNELLGSGVNFRLPSEAEWEYACRAGTSSALYTGGLTLVGANNGPELDGIAWYGGNSGVGYDLEESYDGSDWPEKQYEFSSCGSRRVKSKGCNSWGLYDMLGNVWEWCGDWYGDYDVEQSEDPFGASSGSVRVVRGGGWDSGARYVRAAFRARDVPGHDDFFLGFRPLSAASRPAE